MVSCISGCFFSLSLSLGAFEMAELSRIIIISTLFDSEQSQCLKTMHNTNLNNTVIYSKRWNSMWFIRNDLTINGPNQINNKCAAWPLATCVLSIDSLSMIWHFMVSPTNNAFSCRKHQNSIWCRFIHENEFVLSFAQSSFNDSSMINYAELSFTASWFCVCVRVFPFFCFRFLLKRLWSLPYA